MGKSKRRARETYPRSPFKGDWPLDQVIDNHMELVNNEWSSESTKIPCLAHVIQLVVKAILGAFNIKLTETEYSDDDINGRSISSAIAKVSYPE
jgi:hypothetical protein